MVRRAVLLGAGHAHLHTIKRAAEFVRGGCQLVLVAPDTFWYSGLATGMLAGIYPPALDQIDVEAMVAKAGGRYMRASATRVDAATRMVYLDVGPPLSYEVVSCNLGSQVALDSIRGAEAHGYAVKPVRNRGDTVLEQMHRGAAEKGDCFAFQGRALPRVGVYAVRQAPVLFHNLLATLEGRPLRPFKPQRRFLLILNLGDGTGLATWGRFHWHGRLAFWLKDRIDRAFLREYQEC